MLLFLRMLEMLLLRMLLLGLKLILRLWLLGFWLLLIFELWLILMFDLKFRFLKIFDFFNVFNPGNGNRRVDLGPLDILLFRFSHNHDGFFFFILRLGNPLESGDRDRVVDVPLRPALDRLRLHGHDALLEGGFLGPAASDEPEGAGLSEGEVDAVDGALEALHAAAVDLLSLLGEDLLRGDVEGRLDDHLLPVLLVQQVLKGNKYVIWGFNF